MLVLKNRYIKSFIICFSFVCLFVVNSVPRRVNAVTGFDDAVVVGGITVTSSMIATLVGCTLVAGGSVIYANTDSTDLHYIAQGLIKTGEGAKYIATQIDSAGKEFLTWTKDGLSYISSTVGSMCSTGVVPVVGDGSYNTSIDISGSYNTKGHAYDSPIYVGPVFSFPSESNISFKVTVNGTPVSATMSKNWFTYTNMQFILYTTSSLGTQLGISVDGVYKNAIKIASTQQVALSDFSVALPSGSICSIPIGSGVKTYSPNSASDVIGSVPSDNSISYHPNIGIPLTDTNVVDTSGGKVYTPDVPIPYGQTWGDIGGDLGITYPHDIPVDVPVDTPTDGTIDTNTGVLNIPILGSILKALLDILSFLKGLLGSLVIAFTKMLTDLFVPTADMFQNFFNDLSTGVSNKFPFNPNILNSLKVSADQFVDIKAFGGVIVSAKFVNDNINFIRTITSCFWIFSLTVYIWRKVNSVVSGGGGDKTEVIKI